MPYKGAILLFWCYPTPQVVIAAIDSPALSANPPRVTTPPSTAKAQLRKRQKNGGSTNCGYSNGFIWTCDKPSYCAATILTNGQAFQYCGVSGAVTQNIYTTAERHWSKSEKCPRSVTCCSSPWPNVITQLYIADGYTVTGWDCNPDKPVTNTIVPDKNVLNPTEFRTSLMNLVQSTSPASSSPGMSKDTTIGIGAGVGAGCGIVLIGAMMFVLWRRKEKTKAQTEEKLYRQNSQDEPELGDRCQHCHQAIPTAQPSKPAAEVECPPLEMYAGQRAEMD